MRRKDREVTDFGKIVELIDQCEIVRLGISDGDYPYIVPVNFAYTVKDQQITLYMHGAMDGRKFQLLSQNPCCSFEMDIPLHLECLYDKRDVTMRYQSVMGKGQVTFLEGEEKERIMDRVIMARHEETKDFAYEKSALKRTAVFQLKVTEITAKANVK